MNSNPPLLSVIIPTCGRSTLERTLQSIRHQTRDDGLLFSDNQIEVLVIGDTHDGTFKLPLSVVPSLCQKYGATYVEYDGGEHMVGHPQRNYGQSIARGMWLSWMQDDDSYVPGAFAAMSEAIWRKDNCVILGQTKTWQVGVVWREKELYEGNIDADCIVVPNVPERLGVWANRYSGDFDFIRDTCELWDNRIFWCPKLFAVGRP